MSAANRSAKKKGHAWERAVVRKFAEVFGADKVRRGFQYKDGTDAPDVVAPEMWIECKAARMTNPRAALRQAVPGAKRAGVVPVAVCKDDGDKPLVMVYLDDFLEIAGDLHELREEA